MFEIKFFQGYRPQNTQYLAVHHSGGLGNDVLAKTQNLTAEDVNREHRARWDFISSLGWYAGYNFFISNDGKITQFRAIGEKTAAQKGFNFKGEVISVCLAGNFTPGVESPTLAQIAALKDLAKEIAAKGVAILPWNIVPHRFFGMTECYGTALADDWARKIITQTVVIVHPNSPSGDEAKILTAKLSLLQQILELLAKVVDLQRQLKFGVFRFGHVGKDCHEADLR